MGFAVRFDLDALGSILELPRDFRIADIRVGEGPAGDKRLEMKLYKGSGKKKIKYVPDFPIHQMPCGHWELCWASLEMVEDSRLDKIEEVDWEDMSSKSGRNHG